MAARIISKHEPSGVLLGKRSSHARYARVGGLCDERRTLDLCQIRKDIVLEGLKKEGMEITKLSLRKIDRLIYQLKQMAFKVLDASGATYETQSAAP